MGRLEASGGTQVVLSDYDRLRIVTADLELIREIVPDVPGNFGCDHVVLADLDNDGLDEILAVKRNPVGVGWCSPYDELRVYRGDGTPYSSNYPIPSYAADGTSLVGLLAVDLDGDQQKEILAASVSPDYSVGTIKAYRADGTPYSAWQFPSQPFGVGYALLADDLNHDGHTEIVIGYSRPGSQSTAVVSDTGQSWPGFPVSGQPFAIVDVDRDGQNEILSTDDRGAVVVIRLDGSVLPGNDWPFNRQTTALPVVADIDGDGAYEILGVDQTAREEPLLRAVSLVSGVEVDHWPIFGTHGQRASGGSISIGDFNNDGNVDIALASGLVQGGGNNGYLIDGVLTVFTTGARFSEVSAVWPMPGQTPANNPVHPVEMPAVRINPSADASVCNPDGWAQGAANPRLLEVRRESEAQVQCESYLRFPLDLRPGKVLSAKLRLDGHRAEQTTGGEAAYAVPPEAGNFDENGLSWQTRPRCGELLGQAAGTSSSWRYHEWDVTTFAAAQAAARASAIAFAVKVPDASVPTHSTFHAREYGWNQPELALVMDLVPTVLKPASAGPVTNQATTLSVLGSDDHGEAGLTYTWTMASGPGHVVFSPNGTNAAKDVHASFSESGTYVLVATIVDASGQTVTSTVTVTVPGAMPQPVWAFAGPKYFNGISTYVDGGESAGASAALTVAFTMMPKALENGIPIDKEPSFGRGGWTVRLHSNGRLTFRLGSDSDKTDVVVAGAYHAKVRTRVVCSFVDGVAKVYIDGTLRRTQARIVQTPRSRAHLRLGIPSLVSKGDKYSGLLEDVRVYDRALSADALGGLTGHSPIASESDLPSCHSIGREPTARSWAGPHRGDQANAPAE
jgi:hypothetical protein